MYDNAAQIYRLKLMKRFIKAITNTRQSIITVSHFFSLGWCSSKYFPNISLTNTISNIANAAMIMAIHTYTWWNIITIFSFWSNHTWAYAWRESALLLTTHFKRISKRIKQKHFCSISQIYRLNKTNTVSKIIVIIITSTAIRVIRFFNSGRCLSKYFLKIKFTSTIPSAARMHIMSTTYKYTS